MALRALPVEVLQHSTEDGDIARCELPFEGVDRVVHLAGRSFVPDSWVNTRAFYETNVLGAINVLEFCRKQSASITLVSSYVYGNPDVLPISEDHSLRAMNPYAHTKILAEAAARYYAEQYGISVTIVRPFNIYGPGQDERFLIPALLKQALDPAEPFITVKDLEPRRDYLHVNDLVALLVSTLRGPEGIYNAGSGLSVSVAELIDIINSFLPSPKPARSLEIRRRQEVLDVRANIRCAGTALGWHPEVSLRQGIRDLIATMRERTNGGN
jgi:nucleoside-diphosphate-sugar epimerase